MPDRPTHFRAYGPAGNVIHEGALPAAGPARFEADTEVGCIVYYDAAEAVAGREEFPDPRSGVTWAFWSDE